MTEIMFGKQKIEFERYPTNSKEYVTIKVAPDKSINVFAPSDISDGELTQIVQKKTRWIIGKFQRLDEVQFRISSREFVSGESFLYKGKSLRLKIRKADEDVIFTDTTSIICKTSKNKNQRHVRKLLENWYKERAKSYFDSRISHISKKFGKRPSKILIRNQILRWGSCTNKGEILLNWRIIMAPPSVIDYVLVHELAHLQEKNHTKKFWEIMKNSMPNYEEKREWLRVNGPKLTVS